MKKHWNILSAVNRLGLLSTVAIVITGRHHHLHHHLLFLLLHLSCPLLPSPLRKTLTSPADEDSKLLDSQWKGARHTSKHSSLLLAANPHLCWLCPLLLLSLTFEDDDPDMNAKLHPYHLTINHHMAHEWCALAITVTGQDKRQVAHGHTRRLTSVGQSLAVSCDVT